MLRLRRFTLSGLAGILTVSLAATASASPSSSPVQDSSQINNAQTGSAYSDTDVVSLLAFGQGEIAEDYPELRSQFRPSVPDDYAATDSDIEFVENNLKLKIDNFHHVVTNAVQSGDPFEVQNAVRETGTALQEISTDLESASGPKDNETLYKGGLWVKDQGIVYTKTAVAAHVGAAVELALAAVIATVVAYDFPNNTNSLDAQNSIASLTSAMNN